MKIVVKGAIASAALAFAHACATPVEIRDDVQVVNPNAFGDAGPLAGAAGQGGAPPGGTAGAGGTMSAAGGAGGTGLSGMPVGAPSGEGLPNGGAAGASAAVFDPGSCDFEDTTGCDTLTCQAACPTNAGDDCLTSCVAIVDCVTDQAAAGTQTSCVTAADPLCGARNGAEESACTTLVEPAGGVNATSASQPAFVARQFVQCICSVPRP